MFYLVVKVCLATASMGSADKCYDVNLELAIEQLPTTQQCYIKGMPTMAKWWAEHQSKYQGYEIRGFKCIEKSPETEQAKTL
jgi:hypothetical protein